MKKSLIFVSAFSILFALHNAPQNYRAGYTAANHASHNHCKRKKPSGITNQKYDGSVELINHEIS